MAVDLGEMLLAAAPDKRKALLTETVSRLPSSDRKDLGTNAINAMSPADRRDIATAKGSGPRRFAGPVWLILVSAIAVVLVGGLGAIVFLAMNAEEPKDVHPVVNAGGGG